MHKQRLATATPDPLAEFNGSASQQGRAVVERRDRPLPDCADSVQYRHISYSQTFFPSAIRLWNTLPVDIYQLSPDSFKTHLSSFRFI